MKKLALGATTVAMLFSLSGCYEEWLKHLIKTKKIAPATVAAPDEAIETAETKAAAIAVPEEEERKPETDPRIREDKYEADQTIVLDMIPEEGEEGEEGEEEEEEEEEYSQSSTNESSSSDLAGSNNEFEDYFDDEPSNDEIMGLQGFLKAEATPENLVIIKNAFANFDWTSLVSSNQARKIYQKTNELAKQENPEVLYQKLSELLPKYKITNHHILVLENLNNIKQGKYAKEVQDRDRETVNLYVSGLFTKASFELQAAGKI